MKTKVMLLCCFVLLTISCSQKKIALFNGQDLSGWVFVTDENSQEDASQTFTSSDGLIRISGQPFGYMRTEQKYSDFVLHTEWRWTAEPADGGIFVMLQEGDQVWPTGLQCQMKGEDLGVLMGGIPIEGVDAPNGFYKKELVDDTKVEKPAGEWNETEISCLGGHVTVTINGVMVNKAQCEAKEGYIGFQSEGGPLEFRNVYLTPVAAK